MKKDLSSAKERVKEALKKEQEERDGPRKRRFVSLCLLEPCTMNILKDILQQRCIFLFISALKGAKIILNMWRKNINFHCFRSEVFLMTKNIDLSEHIRCKSSNTTWERKYVNQYSL